MTKQQRCVGIDIGKETIAVCEAHGEETNPQKWPVEILDLTDPTWSAQLAKHLDKFTVVTLEPTGWHLSRPIVAVAQRLGCQILYVNHLAAAATREDRVTPQKTDVNDARALALKARDFAYSRHSNGMTPYNPITEDLNIALRLRLGELRRCSQQRTRAKNRLSALAHCLWPCLSQFPAAYHRCILAGAITAIEVRALALKVRNSLTPVQHYEHSASRAALFRLAERIPDDVPSGPQPIKDAVHRSFEDLYMQDNEEVRIDAELVELIESEPLAAITACWRTVPGASDHAIAALHAACRCEAGKLTADEFKAAVGCHPLRNESGQYTESRESKRGFKQAKGLLHIWTLTLLSPSTRDNPVRDYFKELKASGHKNAIHAARGKLARMLQGIAKTQTEYHYSPRLMTQFQERPGQ
jgi:hypothetical protein